MKNTEIKKILAEVYRLDVESDIWLDKAESAVNCGDKGREALCRNCYDVILATISGMTTALKCLGYQLTDKGDGMWKIESLNKADES